MIIVRVLALSTILLLVGWTAHAEAASDPELPAPPLASDTLRYDGTSLLTNPANMPFSQGVDMGLGMRLTTDNQRGDGVYGYAQVTTKFRLSLGAGVAARVGHDRGLTGFASIGWGTGPVAIAVRYRVYQATEMAIHGTSTSDIALTWRPTTFMSLSGVTTNLWTPTLRDGDRLHRAYRVESGWHVPNGRFGAALQYHARNDNDAYDHYLGLHTRFRVARGVQIFLSSMKRVAGPSPDQALHSSDFQIEGGLMLQAGHVASELGFHTLRPVGEASTFGGSALFHYRDKSNAPVHYDTGRVLNVTLSGKLSERASKSLFDGQKTNFSDVMMQLRTARDSPQLQGVYLHLGGVELGVAQLWELRRALDDIRAADRHVIVYLERGGLRDLYLAAAGDYIMASPAFISEDAGIRVQRVYIADLLERLGIEAQFVRRGDYKSAVETFTRNEPSAAADKNLHQYIEDVWTTLTQGLCSGRPNAACPHGQFPLDQLITADSLHASQWIQTIGYEDDLAEHLVEHFGQRILPIPQAALQDDRYERFTRPSTIALLVIDGDLVSGKSGANFLTRQSFTGTASIEEAIKTIRQDAHVKGVIIRINSPGGSLFASDEIRHAFEKLQKSKLPIVFSLGDMAASGGYYVTTVDAPVFAAPTTLTGSIGIYAGTFAIQQLLERVGVHTSQDAFGGPAKLFSGRTWTDEDIAWMEASMDKGYDRFTTLVGSARDLTAEDVERVAQGQIWSGKAAKQHALTDRLGGLLDAYDALCADLRGCASDPFPLQRFGERKGLPLPHAILKQLPLSNQEDATTALSKLMEQMGISTVMAPVLSMLPSKAREARLDSGGQVIVQFE